MARSTTSSSLSSFVTSGLLLLAAFPIFVAAAPARFAHGHHVGSHHSVLQAAQHSSYLSKRLVSARHEGHEDQSDQNCTDADTDPETGTDGGLVEVEVVASGWYAGWDTNFTVADIPWQQYSQLTFAFAYVLSTPRLAVVQWLNFVYPVCPPPTAPLPWVAKKQHCLNSPRQPEPTYAFSMSLWYPCLSNVTERRSLRFPWRIYRVPILFSRRSHPPEPNRVRQGGCQDGYRIRSRGHRL
jgi:hypothetical protein